MTRGLFLVLALVGLALVVLSFVRRKRGKN
jgi:hypothetical protein